MRRAMLWLPPLLYMLLIFYLSSQSKPIPIVTEHVWDKLLHFIEYGILGGLWCRTMRGEGMDWVAALAAATLIASLYGASDEWHQSFVPLRDSSVRDWLSDMLGGSAGAAIYAAFGFFSTASRPPHRPPR